MGRVIHVLRAIERNAADHRRAWWLAVGSTSVITALTALAGTAVMAAPASSAPSVVLSGPAWDLRSKTLRGGLWTFTYDVTAREASSALRVTVRINGRVQHRNSGRCRPGVPCQLRGEDVLDTDALPRGELRISVTGSDDSRSTEVAFTVHSTPVVPVCPRRHYQVFFLGRHFSGLAFTYADQMCEPTVGHFSGVHRVFYVYGDCDASRGQCEPPLSVSSGPLCEAHPILNGTPPGRPIRLLHVPAELYNQSGTWLLELYTAHTTIGLNTSDASARSRRRIFAAAKHLHYAPGKDTPTGSRALRHLPANASGPSIPRLPEPDLHEFNSRTGC